MKLQEFKAILSTLDRPTFVLPNDTAVPPHFHLSEVGEISKNFIDCGGTVRSEKTVNFQLWSADDYNHRLETDKILKIIELAEKQLGLKNLEIEVEYQSDTIAKYGLEFDGQRFLLTSQNTDCLAKDKCGITENPSVKISSDESTSYCSPESGCC